MKMADLPLTRQEYMEYDNILKSKEYIEYSKHLEDLNLHGKTNNNTTKNVSLKPILVIVILVVGFEIFRCADKKNLGMKIYNFIFDYPGWSIIIGCFALWIGNSTVKFLLSDY
jgi:hypothetical protein